MKPSLLEFIKRNRSHSPSEGFLNITSRPKSSQIPKSNSITLSQTKKQSIKDSPELTEILQDIKLKLKKLESTSTYLEKWKEDLSKKEEDLKNHQKLLQESEKSQKKTAKKLKETQKALQIKEETLRRSIKQEREEMLQEINKTFQKKSLEIQQKEQQLSLFLESIQKELRLLEDSKSESVQLECSALLNELIGTILLQQYHDQILELQPLSHSPSLSSPKFDSFDPIEEVSNESSQDYSDIFSTKYIKNHEFILQECDDISKENNEITEKLEALMASLKLE